MIPDKRPVLVANANAVPNWKEPVTFGMRIGAVVNKHPVGEGVRCLHGGDSGAFPVSFPTSRRGCPSAREVPYGVPSRVP